jgi:hypothetical protein
MVTVDLRRRLQDERCAEGGDVKTHLDKLQAIREDLIAMGADPGDENFVAIVLGSLPATFETYLSALTGASALLGKKLDPDMVLQGISDEAERRKVRATGNGEKEAAFYGNGSKKPKKMMECYNCHKRGHMAKDCWAKGGGKEGQNPHRKGAGKANTAKAEEASDAAWMAAIHGPDDEEFDLFEEDGVDQGAIDDPYADMPPLEDVSDSDEEKEDDATEEEAVEKTSLTSDRLIAAAITIEPEYELEIYDSGATQHMTPSRHRLTNYTAIRPRGIMAADNKHFEALGKGDMYVQVPNGKNGPTKVLMKDVLYAPKLGGTLISIGRITQTGYSLHFRHEECRIFDARDRRIGAIPPGTESLTSRQCGG